MNNPEQSHTLSSPLTSNSLRASGIFYLLADVISMTSGFRRHDKAQIGTGLAFGTGDALLIAFGGKNERRQLDAYIKELKAHLETKGIAIPRESTMGVEDMAKPEGLLENIYDFLQNHFNAVKITLEVIGGISAFKAGLNQKNPRKQAAAAVLIAGWTAAELVREKEIDHEEYRQAGPLKKFFMHIQEKPLRLAGWSGNIANVLGLVGTFEERSKYRKGLEGGTPHYRWDLVSKAVTFIANSLYSISTKPDVTTENDALANEIYSFATHIVRQQPETIRKGVIEQVAEFIEKEGLIKDTREQAIIRINQALENTKNVSQLSDKKPIPDIPLQGKRFYLSGLAEEDYESLLQIAQTEDFHFAPLNARKDASGHKMPLQDSAQQIGSVDQYMREAFEQDNYIFAIRNEQGELVGAVELLGLRQEGEKHEAEIGIFIDKHYQHDVPVKDALTKALEWAHDELRLNALRAMVDPENKARNILLQRFVRNPGPVDSIPAAQSPYTDINGTPRQRNLYNIGSDELEAILYPDKAPQKLKAVL
ncbi:MAG TPA: GNAT family N-acetyltransferase [Rickettsiales bacterium]|nr:GNAT family N-acetyltransferase [Rickettsiales bacterium]